MVRILGALGAEFSIDPKRIYLVGVSMGGHGTWSALMHYPDRFAAAAPMMGAGDPSAAHRIRAAVWAFHGSQDTTVPPERSREMVHAMKQAGATPRYTEYSDLGHSGPGQRAVSEPEFFPWLFSQRLD